jgi:CTP synthase (UTP-ammonia lyase)
VWIDKCGLLMATAVPELATATIWPVSDPVRIGIFGDFNSEFRSHHAINESLRHAALKLGIDLESEWLPTPSLLAPDAEKVLESFDGFWASPGSPYKSFDGMLKGIECARRRDWPFVGT